MSNVKAESLIVDAFESADAASLAAAADRNHGCMIASRSSQANALSFAAVCRYLHKMLCLMIHACVREYLS
jgi:hypothetical protein